MDSPRSTEDLRPLLRGNDEWCEIVPGVPRIITTPADGGIAMTKEEFKETP